MPTEENGTQRSFEPGTFERTRNNIGPIDPEEAKAMAAKLGGEILPERSIPVDPKTMPRKKRRDPIVKASGKSSSDVTVKSASQSSTAAQKSASPTHSYKTMHRTEDDIPEMPSKDLRLINKLMMSEEYEIKPDYGVFNFLFSLSSRNKEKVLKSFGTFKLKKNVEHMQSFISTIKTFIQISPDSYKAKIATETELKFKFLRTVGKWTMQNIKVFAVEAESQSQDLTVPLLIPITRAMYHELITVYYIGEQQVSALIKEVYTDLCTYQNANKEKIQNLAKVAITEWLYVYNQIIKGMYPLLMRMSCNKYVEFPKFFTQEIASILKFLNRSKFDLLIPEKKKKPEDEKKRIMEEARKKVEEKRRIPGKIDETVKAGLNILNRMFPEAGFDKLETHPDMYPYFQPLYNFPEGLNLLSPENGLQVTIVLMKIIEDLFHGCHNISFTLEGNDKLSTDKDNLLKCFSEWSLYIEELFFKNYCGYLSNFMNSSFTSSDYATSQYGKETVNNIYWRTKLDFLPNFKFNAPTLTKPRADNKYRPLYSRVTYLRELFTELANNIDSSAESKKNVVGIKNPWDRYTFDIPNEVSKRMDVFLGAKKGDTVTNALNSSLIKYTLCIISVLDWWINNPESPAYTTEASHFYRTNKDGAAEFSVQVREDQNKLFADSIKNSLHQNAN